MPFEKLTDEQILAILTEKPSIERVPGVTLFWVDLVGPLRAEPALVVFLDARHRAAMRQLPVSIAGVPVIVKIEDRKEMIVLETVDPRDNGGAWPNFDSSSEE